MKTLKHRKRRRTRSTLNDGPGVRIGIAQNAQVKLWPAFSLLLRKEAYFLRAEIDMFSVLP